LPACVQFAADPKAIYVNSNPGATDSVTVIVAFEEHVGSTCAVFFSVTENSTSHMIHSAEIRHLEW
jgi:hypothetical protein